MSAPAPNPRESFWSEIFTLRGSVTPFVIRRALAFGAIALGVYLLNEAVHPHLGIDLGPYEVAGAALGLLLVFRTNAGYDRWYEARRLLGSMTNDSRNLAMTCLTHGPADPAWRETMVRRIAAYGHVCRATLRDEPLPAEARSLVGPELAAELQQARHMPTLLALRIGEMLRRACDELGMHPLGFLQADQERARLIDALGGCERIVRTPLPAAYSINLRRLIFIYLLFTPFALLGSLGWLCPLVTMLIAYPILSVDQLGVELQQPFATDSLNHLPVDAITARIEADLLSLLAASRLPSSGG